MSVLAEAHPLARARRGRGSRRPTPAGDAFSFGSFVQRPGVVADVAARIDTLAAHPYSDGAALIADTVGVHREEDLLLWSVCLGMVQWTYTQAERALRGERYGAHDRRATRDEVMAAFGRAMLDDNDALWHLDHVHENPEDFPGLHLGRLRHLGTALVGATLRHIRL